MNKIKVIGAIVGMLFILLVASPTLAAVSNTEGADIENVAVADMPAIGKWMLTPAALPADWLGQKYRNMDMREPINIIMIDEVSASPEEAIKRLDESCSQGGYPARYGHSSGYLAFIGGKLYDQIPQKKNSAFSNGSFLFPNNHGRIFGPCFFEGKYYFTAAFSREVVNVLAFKHIYSSFTKARDTFATDMVERSGYKACGKVNLTNVSSDASKWTTGDHDGFALVLVLQKDKTIVR